MADNNDNQVNPAGTAIAGAVIGAAVGAAAVALSDKENRRKVAKTIKDVSSKIDKKKIEELKTQGQKTLDSFKKKVQELRNQAEDVVEEEKADAKKKLAGPKNGRAAAAA